MRQATFGFVTAQRHQFAYRDRAIVPREPCGEATGSEPKTLIFGIYLSAPRKARRV